jgi:hypothetical protein
MGPTEMDAHERVFGDATEGDRAYFAREDTSKRHGASSTPCSRPGRRYTSRSLALGSPVGGQDVHGQRRQRCEVGAAPARRRQSGGAENGRASPYVVAREKDWLLARIGEKSDLTLRALLKELADRGLVVSYYALWHFLHHEGVTLKKAFAPQNRTGRTSPGDVSARKARQATIDPRRLVFIDETPAFAGPGSGRKPT